MQNIIIVDLDTERDQTVLIRKPGDPISISRAELQEMICLDMATLCEGLVTLIHVADQQGLKPSAESLRDCIEHLTEGFANAGYTGTLGEVLEKAKKVGRAG